VDAPATLVWIAPEPPDADQRKALASWAAAHGTQTVDPGDWHPALLAVDAHVAAEADDLLDRARDALAADDGADVDAALAKADALLRAHAALPQAAWLMAEVERARAVRWLRVPPIDREAADRAWKRAQALDGGRQASVAEQGLEGQAAEASIDVAGPLDSAEQAWIDGRRAARHVDTRAGLHSVVVTWAGDPVWAEWRDAPAGPSVMTLDPPRADPCSIPDVASARLDGDHVAADAVQCSSWIAVLPAGAATRAVRVAVCAGGRCAALVEWRLADPWLEPGPVAVARTGGWPAWATWSVVGAGAAVAAGTAAVLVGALRAAPAETRFVTGGIQRE
jgi:hypothetical protein